MSASLPSGPYQYAKLHENQLRYLSLHPGIDKQPLQCSLHAEPVGTANFEAVSYVWGSDVRDQQILCDGHVLSITANLSSVLRRVRLPDAPRKLWVDLICINQEDLEEKGYQVAIMGQIYRRASRVLVLIGSDDGDHGGLVCSLVDDVCAMVKRTLPHIQEDWNTFPHFDATEPLREDLRWESVGLLLKDVWFTRGWVVREAGFAQDALVIWGTSQFSWDGLMRTLIWLSKRSATTLYAKGLDSLIPLAHLEVFEDRNPAYAKLFTTEQTWVNQSMMGYLSLSRQLELKDPRDRVYAFLELVQNEERRVHLRPNYKYHFLHVYQQFAEEYIGSTGYINLLSNVEHTAESLNSGIPSWIPRWDLCLTRAGYSFAPADSAYPVLTTRQGLVSQPTVLLNSSLKAKAAIFDSVIYASDTFNISTTTPRTLLNTWRALENFRHKTPYPPRHMLSVFISALTTGTREGDFSNWLRSEIAYYTMLYKGSQYPQDLKAPSSLYVNHDATINLLHNTIKGYTHNRKIILTQRGYIGLAPAIAQEGDACGIVFGCTTPCILRPAGQLNQFRYLGAAFILGRQHWTYDDGHAVFNTILGSESSKEWVEWNVEEKDVYLC